LATMLGLRLTGCAGSRALSSRRGTGSQRQLRARAAFTAAARASARRRAASSGIVGLVIRAVQEDVCVADLDAEQVENLRELCNALVCKSSPAVESTVKSLARDIDALREGQSRNLSILAPEIVYKDPFVELAGLEALKTFAPIEEAGVDKATACVKAMRMIEGDQAVIEWRLTGENSAGALAIDWKSTLTLNLITGRVLRLEEEWDTSASDPSAAALFSTKRTAYSMSKRAASIGDKIGKALDDLTSGDDEMEVFADPRDPMKFFQQKDTFQDDAIFFVGLLTVLYIITKVLYTLNTI